jgi:hypothetical protein
MRNIRTKQPRGQKWSTFLRTHAADIWACDFLQVTDLFFRPLFAFFNTLAEVSQGDPRGRDPISSGCLGGATPPGSHPVWARTDISDS